MSLTDITTGSVICSHSQVFTSWASLTYQTEEFQVLLKFNLQWKIIMNISNSRKCAARVKALSTLQQKLARVLDKGRNENISGVQFNKDIFQLPRANPFNFFPPSLQPGLSHEFEFLVRAKTQLEVATKGTTHCYISPVPTSAFIRPDMSFSSAGNMFQPPQCLFISNQKFVFPIV